MLEDLAQKASANAKAFQVYSDAFNCYQSLLKVKAHLDLYQAGTDADFVDAVDAFYTAGERGALGQIANLMSALAVSLETDHEDFTGTAE